MTQTTQTILVLTDGFEEIEALATVDVLRRADITTTTVSLTGERMVTGAHGVAVQADALFAEAQTLFDEAEMLIVPGGTTRFNEHDGLKTQLSAFAAQDKWLAAICAAPMVLAGLGLLKGKKATCYPGFEQYLSDAELQQNAAVVVDGKIITGRGPGLALDFALELVTALSGTAQRNTVAQGLLLAV